MFEFEVNHAHLNLSGISDHDYIKAQFNKTDADITAVSLLCWEEHCTECAMPQCYQTCDLYQMRKDGKCRRFVNGISPIYNIANVQNCIVKICFKRWGTLLTSSKCRMYNVGKARFIEHVLNYAAEKISKIPDKRLNILGRRGISSRLMLRLKHMFCTKGLFADKDIVPDYFLAEIFNPNDRNLSLSISMNNVEGNPTIPYLQLLDVKEGFNRFIIPYEDIVQTIDIKARFLISFNPNILNAEDEGLVLYFGMNTFATDSRYVKKQAINDSGQAKIKSVKIIVWDLDNTLWDGILVEDGADSLTLKPNIVEIIRELDKRGIVNSIASKNNPDEALKQLEQFGISELFVFPKIGWGSKGAAIKKLVQEFNVGADTVAFIDDSPFEREEVGAVNPKVRIYHHDEFASLLEKPEFNPAVSSESSKRRYYYLAQGTRSRFQASFSGEYADFIRNCNINLAINAASSNNIDRIHELVQRTNQMNFSGNRYTREKLAVMIESENYDNYCMECNDKFGDYGIIGFCLFDKKSKRLVDLMFSCRVQSKRIEHEFLTFLMTHYKSLGFQYLEAEFIKSDRNQQVAKVFTDLNFEKAHKEKNRYIYKYNLEKEIIKNNLIKVTWKGKNI